MGAHATRQPGGADGPVRVDRWLWAARLFRTRSLAAEAVKGGLVEVNGQRVKPARELRVGDELRVTRGQVRLELVVRGLSARRGPAAEAARLYEETEASRAARERLAAERRLAAAPAPPPGGRPTKRDRRRFEALRGRAR
ncbi:MAG: RNA-binding S4 domain-containing protein [Solirubrobacteraceae bacterium]|nr:RNA-binding S4 domain-containing protein [Solirubrobacteraceae bacterium]